MKRSRDTNQLAKLVVDIATGQLQDFPITTSGRAKGGLARAASMNSGRRREITKSAAAAHGDRGSAKNRYSKARA